jgi:hypothetical protein
MNDSFDAARIHRQDLDREIESIRTEQFLRSTAAPSAAAPGFAGRARAGLGNRLISLGVAVLGSADPGRRSAAPTSDGCA